MPQSSFAQAVLLHGNDRNSFPKPWRWLSFIGEYKCATLRGLYV